MKQFLLFFSLLLMTIAGRSQDSKYALEITSVAGVSWFSSLSAIDSKLTANSFPSLTNDLDLVQSGGGHFTFKIKRWGILAGGSTYNISSKANANGHYYNGTSESYDLGVSYDVIQAKWFTFAPYFCLGEHNALIYLDYEFANNVNPTSLRITARESTCTFGGKCYFRVGAWKDYKWQLFINGEVFYKLSVNGTWRFDDKLIDSEDFNLSNTSVMGGLSLRYSF
ncbi:MAG: hypothetical protein ACK5IJ_04300 [Mangrovibacterium sp.]